MKSCIEYERQRSEGLQLKLDTILRITPKPRQEDAYNEPKPLRQTQSPMKQRHTLEAESRRKYWAEQVRKAEELPNNVVTSDNGE